MAVQLFGELNWGVNPAAVGQHDGMTGWPHDRRAGPLSERKFTMRPSQPSTPSRGTSQSDEEAPSYARRNYSSILQLVTLQRVAQGQIINVL